MVTMISISIRSIVKEKLNQFKEKEGCTSYSDAINLLLERNNKTNDSNDIKKRSKNSE